MIENATNLTNATKMANSIDISIVTGVIIAIGVVIGLIFEWIAYRNKKIGKIEDIFSSDEMRKGMMNLRHFVDDNKSNFVDIFRDLLNKNNPKGDEISLDSGRFFQHIKKKVFNNREKAKNWIIKRTMNIGTVKFLLEIVDPLEKVKAEKGKVKHADYIAKECRRIFKDELKERK
jgi:hypothetical protein